VESSLTKENDKKLLAGLIPEKDLAAEEGKTPRTWRNRRNRGDVPPWCRIGRDVYYYETALPAWREARMQKAVFASANPYENEKAVAR